MSGLETSVQLSAAVWKGRAGHGGPGAGLELKCAEVCVHQQALVSALMGFGGSAGIFSTLRLILLTIATCCCLEDTVCLKISPV